MSVFIMAVNLKQSEAEQATYHEQSPKGVVEKDNRGSQKHGGAYEFVKLRETVS